MSSMGFDLEGFEELGKSLEEASKRFPATTERILKKEARAIVKDSSENTKRRIKGHGRHDEDNKKDKFLEDSFRPGKPKKNGNNYTNAVVSSAPHYHLVEEGHDLYSHRRKNKRGRGKIGSDKLIGHVEGKKIVAQVMAKKAESEAAQEMGERLLDAILKEAGFDD